MVVDAYIGNRNKEFSRLSCSFTTTNFNCTKSALIQNLMRKPKLLIVIVKHCITNYFLCCCETQKGIVRFNPSGMIRASLFMFQSKFMAYGPRLLYKCIVTILKNWGTINTFKNKPQITDKSRNLLFVFFTKNIYFVFVCVGGASIFRNWDITLSIYSMYNMTIYIERDNGSNRNQYFMS